VFYNLLACKSCCPGPWAHTNNPGSQLDSALGPAACNFQAVPLLGATALVIITTPIKIPLSQSKSSLLEAIIVEIASHPRSYVHLRLLSSTWCCYHPRTPPQRMLVPFVTALLHWKLLLHSAASPLTQNSTQIDDYNSEFSLIEAAVIHKIALPASRSTRCSYPTRDLHARLPANTLNRGYSFTRSSYSTQSFSL
jgi:hypothetical protein